ncbi:MAG: BON domain-containing protein [Rhodovibrionaceae bacterium]
MILRQTLMTITLLSLVACAGSAPPAATDQRGFAAQPASFAQKDAADAQIEEAVGDALFRHDLALFAAVTVSAAQGRVTLFGELRDRHEVVEAQRLAWSVPGVRAIESALRVAAGPQISGLARDRWIRSQLQRAVAGDPAIDPAGYSFEAVDREIYLLGTARSRAELERVLAHARKIAYVRGVANHVRVAGRRG